MQFVADLWSGRYGLAKTYWLFGVLAGLPWGIGFGLVEQGSPTAILLGVAFCAYFFVVNVGIWKAASAYKGASAWSALAKAAAGFGFVVIAIALLAIITAKG